MDELRLGAAGRRRAPNSPAILDVTVGLVDCDTGALLVDAGTTPTEAAPIASRMPPSALIGTVTLFAEGGDSSLLAVFLPGRMIVAVRGVPVSWRWPAR
ncbi:MAG TPA: hypothetical protein VLU24_09525 [Mycobacterium sp.]|nr:hypothetical protein [Mycobacterium sp.]